MQRVKYCVVADIDASITDLHVLLTRLGAPNSDVQKDAQDALVLAMIELGNKLHVIRTWRDITKMQNSLQHITSFESGAYTETFAVLDAMPWRCAEARDLNPSLENTTEVSLCEALVAIAPAVFMLKGAHFSLADAGDDQRWGDVLAAITVFEGAYKEHTGEAFGLAVAIRALSGPALEVF